MKKEYKWQLALGLILITLSFIVYYIHFLIFRDFRHIMIYLIGDIAFVFIEVLMVTLVLHQLLVFREKRALLNKLNMVIGAFYSEAGVELLKIFSSIDDALPELNGGLLISNKWTDKEFRRAHKIVADHHGKIDIKKCDLDKLKIFLLEKRQFMLNLLENPNLLEHETFTNLLWAVFHLTDELSHRESLSRLGDQDMNHLSGDINRAYIIIIREWLSYMKHLKHDYPYLFSLAMRTNPFDEDARIEVK